MTDLIKQLEDKKKEVKDKELLLGSLFVSNGEYISLKDKTKGQMLDLIFSNNCIDNRTAILDWIELKECQAEIAILEQAIAEMQKQRQEALNLILKIRKYAHWQIVRDGAEPILPFNGETYQARNGVAEYLRNKFDITEIELQQLNQPKTEDGNN